jgi:hypothetical protein
MFNTNHSVSRIIIALVLAAGFWLLRGAFRPEAREQRRRAQSHRPVISTANRPMVKLAVDADKARIERKRGGETFRTDSVRFVASDEGLHVTGGTFRWTTVSPRVEYPTRRSWG